MNTKKHKMKKVLKSSGQPLGNPSDVFLSDPSRALFNPEYLPPELLDGVSMKDVVKNVDFSAFDILSSWLRQKSPTVAQKQTCTEVLTGTNENVSASTLQDLRLSAKLASMAYMLPYFMPNASVALHMRNENFCKYMNGFVADATFLAYQNMDGILEDRIDLVNMPVDAQIAGYYIRTPIKLWDKKGKRSFTIPTWSERHKLLQNHIIGNVNVYVLRRNLQDGYECFVLFRGTSNEFNGIPQFGEHMKETQIYHVPTYDPVSGKTYPEGSDKVPLFNKLYSEMVDDVMPHIQKCLDCLQAMNPNCKRILITGHSMGGAMVLHYCYKLKITDEKQWSKTVFRSFAAPMCLNDPAIQKVEQWIIDSQQVDKYLEVVNTDDFVNLQYKLGGKEGLKKSIQQGTNDIGGWLVDAYLSSFGNEKTEMKSQKTDDKLVSLKHTEISQKLFRIVDLYPEIAFSAFLRGALKSQILSTPKEKKAPFRLGQRAEEVKLWQSLALARVYNGTLKLFFCDRNVDWKTEYIGKSHGQYMDTTMNMAYSSLKLYEDELYRYYHAHGLRANNNLHMVSLFPEADMQHAKGCLQDYGPLHKELRVVRKSHKKNL